MKTIEIFKNYGCLTHEKEVVYTYGAEQPTAVTSDKLTVAIPDGWELSEDEYGRAIITAPWGWSYNPNDLLAGHMDTPMFAAHDKDNRYHSEKLKVIEHD